MGAALPTHFDAELRGEDRALLDRYLSGYLKLLDGRAPVDSEARKRFRKVAEGVAMPLTSHEAAFVRWQIEVGWRERPKPTQPQSVFAGGARRAAAMLTAKGSSAAASVAGWANVPLSAALASVTTWYNALLATEASSQLDQWMRESLVGETSIYDRAMDAVFVETGVGGMYHRLFDGTHDLAGAWSAVAGASTTDVRTQEIAGYFAALWNDLVTPMGLPLASLDKAQFDQFASQAEGLLGVSKQWLVDAASVTATEIAGVTIGALAICLSWSTAETEEVSRLAGSTILASALAANPALLIIALVCLVRAFHLARHGADLSGLLSGVSQGGAGSAAFVVAASLVSGPIWVTALSGIVACVVAVKATQHAGRQAARVDWSLLAQRTLSFFKTSRAPSSEHGALLLLPS